MNTLIHLAGIFYFSCLATLALLIAGYYMVQRRAKIRDFIFGKSIPWPTPFIAEDIYRRRGNGKTFWENSFSPLHKPFDLYEPGAFTEAIKRQHIDNPILNNHNMNTQQKQFATPLKIYGSMKQLKSMSGELEKMGYKDYGLKLEPGDCIKTAFDDKSNVFCFDYVSNFFKFSRHECHCNDWQKVLALAAMTKDIEFTKGELLYSIVTGTFETNHRTYNPSLWRKATVEEIEKHFGTTQWNTGKTYRKGDVTERVPLNWYLIPDGLIEWAVVHEWLGWVPSIDLECVKEDKSVTHLGYVGDHRVKISFQQFIAATQWREVKPKLDHGILLPFGVGDDMCEVKHLRQMKETLLKDLHTEQAAHKKSIQLLEEWKKEAKVVNERHNQIVVNWTEVIKELYEEQLAHRATKQKSSYAQLVTMKEKITLLEHQLDAANDTRIKILEGLDFKKKENEKLTTKIENQRKEINRAMGLLNGLL